MNRTLNLTERELNTLDMILWKIKPNDISNFENERDDLANIRSKIVKLKKEEHGH